MHYRNGKCPDSGILLSYNDDDCSQGSDQIVEAFRAQKKMIYLNHIYQNMILDQLMMITILDINYMFLI